MRPIVLALVVLAPSVTQAQTGTIVDMQWLIGCWERTRSTGRTVELWTAPDGGVMMGVSYSVTDTSARETEQLRLWYTGDTLVYEAHPASQTRTLFKYTGQPGGELAFENPAHDFPQRITYRRQGADSLIVRIEGDRNGRRQPVTFPFRRVTCGGLAPSKAAAMRIILQSLYDEMASRESREPGGRWAWFAEHSLPGYVVTVWSAPGSTVAVLDTAFLHRNIESTRRAMANQPPQEVRSSAKVERVLLRGDSIQALVSASTTRILPDSTGAKHERVTAQRWIDNWFRQRETLRLLSTTVIWEEIRMDGRPVVVDGRPVPR